MPVPVVALEDAAGVRSGGAGELLLVEEMREDTDSSSGIEVVGVGVEEGVVVGAGAGVFAFGVVVGVVGFAAGTLDDVDVGAMIG